MTRETIEDIELAGTFIAKGTHITVDVASLHMSPKNWKNPEQFIPERFEEGGEYESNLGTTWTPFSSGSRQCLGINFSLTEQRVVLAMICKFDTYDPTAWAIINFSFYSEKIRN